MLVDEIEKAHGDVFNVFLQILDDGRLTDSQGRTVDFKNTIIVMTSNVGSQHLIDGANDTGEIPEAARLKVMAELRANFRPEFLNRVDETLLFKTLTFDEIKCIVDLQLERLRQRLADRHIRISLSDAAKDYVAREGYDPVYGARPLKRFLQRELETALARKLLAGEVVENSEVVVGFADGALTFDCRPLEAPEPLAA